MITAFFRKTDDLRNVNIATQSEYLEIFYLGR